MVRSRNGIAVLDQSLVVDVDPMSWLHFVNLDNKLKKVVMQYSYIYFHFLFTGQWESYYLQSPK